MEPDQPSNDEQNITNVQAVNADCRIPPFNATEIGVWFEQMEFWLALKKIHSDAAKFNTIITLLSPSIYKQIRDVAMNPPATDKYAYLKENMLARFGPSNTEQLKKLLSGLQLGNNKPSHLLSEMRHLAGSALHEEAVKELWLQQLPPMIASILAVFTDQNLNALAQAADKIVERTSAPYASTVAVPSQPTVSNNMSTTETLIWSTLSEIRREVQGLSRQVQLLHDQQQATHRRRRSSSSNTSHRNESQTCMYHRRFGNKAKKCTSPCDWASTSANSKN